MKAQHPAGVGRSPAVRRPTFLLLLSGLACGFAPAPAILAETVQVTGQQIDFSYDADIAEAAQRYGIPETWVRAVLVVESDGDPLAVSSAGALGLMQVMPDTWAELRDVHHLGDDPFLPRDNIHAGTAYLRAMWDRYGNVGAMLAAYNSGPRRYDEYLESGRELPAETRAYVAALVPLLGGDPLAPSTFAGSPSVTDWRDAPLFVSVPRSAESAPTRQKDGSANAASAAPLVSPNPLAPSSGEVLFAVRSASAGAP
ncbi:lytic transglycosylase domain-containing protein [Aquamicrobium segne]|uniref:Lytic transglycosylase domain-containing protein n=1 Tax=Aquamicrobium segne TaxID=469547 RepID=A0ABW0H107_9HYPH